MAKNTTKHPMLSIITTFYNAEDFIIGAIESINKQDKTGITYEYILVDDKSKDDTRYKIDNYIEAYVIDKENWKIIEPEENLGCGGARKFGIDASTGDYLMFLDADDYYMHTDFIKRALNDIQTEKADIIEYGVIFNQPDGSQINNTSTQKIVINNPIIAELAMFKDNLIKFNVWSKIYSRRIIETRPYDTSRTFEDVRTTPYWIKEAKKIVVMPTPEINYRAAGGSIIRKDPLDTRLGTITAIAELFDDPFMSSNLNIMRAMYGRAMVDLEAVLHNHSSKDKGFNEMSKLNTKMLSKIYPHDYEKMTFHIETFDPASLEENHPEKPEDLISNLKE